MAVERGPGRYIRKFSDAPFPPDEQTIELIAMFESGSFLKSFVPAGVAGIRFHYHTVDQLYFILEGELTVVIGSETITARKHELVYIPRTFPHRNFNHGDVDELHLEIILPTPAPFPPATVSAERSDRKPPENLVRTEESGRHHSDPSLPNYESTILAERNLGFESGHVRIDRTRPGGGGPGLHIHRFDQFFFVLEGVLSVEVAGEAHEVHPHELAIMSQGAVHRQWNEGPNDVKMLTLVLPEPQPDVRWDMPVHSFSGDFSAARP